MRSPIEGGRLGVYTALGASVSAIPLPWVPDSLVRRVRGALVHDIAVRHGLSLTQDARDVLCEPSGPDGPRGLLAQAVSYLGVRLAARTLTRFGPIGMVWPVRNALRTFVLGHLFDRYLEAGRTERAVRVDVDEARRVRQAIDGALARALTVEAPPAEEPTVIDDQRDAVTALMDGLLGLAAGVPGRLMGRLDAAFDDLLAHRHG
ncbi:MAG TPA: hypothetical protein VIF15_16995 [Polyangiaceae bacterium]